MFVRVPDIDKKVAVFDVQSVENSSETTIIFFRKRVGCDSETQANVVH